jgi:hypothetical protein
VENRTEANRAELRAEETRRANSKDTPLRIAVEERIAVEDRIVQ